MLEVIIKRDLSGFNLDVDLAVNREILSILGPSGSGKTMTLLCIAGLIRPDQGWIKLNGRTLFSSEEGIFIIPQKRKIGFVFQNYALFPHMTVAENIAYSMHGRPGKEVKSRVNELLELLHIPALRNRYPKEISSGQQQRVALARAVAPEPEALLLDEPFSALDTYRRERLEFELLALYRHYKGDVLFVTHDLEQGFKLGKRLAIYDHGQIVQCEDREVVISAPKNRTAARLTGVKNLFDGMITGISQRNVKVFVPEFETTFKVKTTNRSGYDFNQMVVMGIRPEHIENVEQVKDNTISCRAWQLADGVASVHCHYYAVTDRQKRYNIEVNRPKPLFPFCFKEGKPYRLYFPPEKLIVLEE